MDHFRGLGFWGYLLLCIAGVMPVQARAAIDYEDHWYYSFTGAGSADNQYRDLFGQHSPAGGSFAEVLSKAQILCNTFQSGGNPCIGVEIQELDGNAACPSIPGWTGAGCRRLRVCLRTSVTSCHQIAFFSRSDTCGTFSSEDGTCSNFPGFDTDDAYCQALAGRTTHMFFQGDDPSGRYCNDPEEGDRCAVVSSNAYCANGECFGFWTYTGDTCSESPADAAPVQDDASDRKEICATLGDELHCISVEDPGCGYVNGERWCVEDLPDGECVFFGLTGSVACDALATAPPAPTDETGTSAAPPDFTVAVSVDGEGPRTINFFSRTTVNQSATVVTGGTSGRRLTGREDGGEFPDGEVGGGTSCDVPPTCSGNALLCGIIRQQWEAACMSFDRSELIAGAGFQEGVDDDPAQVLPTEEVDVDDALSGIEGWLMTDECPAPLQIDLSAIGGPVMTIELDQMCTLAGVVGVMLWMGAWMWAIRIVVEAI